MPDEKKPLGESLKKKLDELEVEKHLHQLVDETEKVAGEAVERAGTLAHERRDDVAGWLDKATGAVNEKTKGQYADKVEKVREGVLAGLDKLAAHHKVGDPVAEIERPEPAETSGTEETPGAGPDAAPTDRTWPTDPVAPAEPDPGKPTDPPLS